MNDYNIYTQKIFERWPNGLDYIITKKEMIDGDSKYENIDIDQKKYEHVYKKLDYIEKILMFGNIIEKNIHQENQNHEVYMGITDQYLFVRKLIEIHNDEENKTKQSILFIKKIFTSSKNDDNKEINVQEMNTKIEVNDQSKLYCYDNEILGIQTDKHLQLFNIVTLNIENYGMFDDQFDIFLFNDNILVASLPERGIFVVNKKNLQNYVKENQKHEETIFLKIKDDDNIVNTNELKKFGDYFVLSSDVIASCLSLDPHENRITFGTPDGHVKRYHLEKKVFESEKIFDDHIYHVELTKTTEIICLSDRVIIDYYHHSKFVQKEIRFPEISICKLIGNILILLQANNRLHVVDITKKAMEENAHRILDDVDPKCNQKDKIIALSRFVNLSFSYFPDQKMGRIITTAPGGYQRIITLTKTS